jgi:hypothetical protein
VAPENPDTSFRVIDRRLFTEEGELRPEAKEQARKEKEAPPPAAPAAVPAATVAPKEAGPPAQATPATVTPPARSPYFELLVKSMANQAAMLLGGMADPATGQAILDLEGAREVIDMLDVLRDKTRGNLAPEEERLLTELLGALQLNYLEISKAAAAQARAEAGKAGARR